MLRVWTPLSTCVGLLAIALLAPRDVGAAWPHDPYANVPVCAAAEDQTVPTIASDGAGGAIIVWQDHRGGANNDVYVQRISAAGAAVWSADGVILCAAANGQEKPAIVSDGAGGAIIVWQDYRGGVSYDIYAQRISAAGVLQWTANGVAICAAANSQVAPKIVSDGAGGAIVVWQDYRGGVNCDIYAQRISAAGAVRWTTNGVALSTTAGDQETFDVAADGFGGAVATWVDHRSIADIYAQRVSSAGAVLWTANGVAVCTATDSQYRPRVVSDGLGGAIVAWYDLRNGDNYDVYVQRVSAAGVAQWATNGASLCALAGNRKQAAIVQDGANGAIIVWQDARSGGNDIYAQRISGDGAMQWADNGVAICSDAGDQTEAELVADGNGGAVVTWHYLLGGVSYDIYAQRISAATGASQWSSGGEAVSLASGWQLSPVLVSDGASGATVVWNDSRSGAMDIYAQRIERLGYLGSPEPELVSVRDVPGDQGGQVKLSWNASYLDADSDPNLYSYDMLRSVPPNQALAALAKGVHTVSSLAELADASATSYLVTQVGTTTYYWECLAAVTALHYVSGYSYLASTTSDSTAAGNPATAFMVAARNASRSLFWLSAPVTGYSVDNLAPGTPAFLASSRQADVTRVRWQRNVEADLAQYRLYRGPSAGFVPDGGNLVTAQADTGYADGGASPYSWYKLTAVDIHGNESAVATLAPQLITGVPGAAATITPRLYPCQPNPFNPRTAIKYDLPVGGPVRLSVFDLAGRLVCTLVDGSMLQGSYEVVWDGRDVAGREVGSGSYLARLEFGGKVETVHMGLIR